MKVLIKIQKPTTSVVNKPDEGWVYFTNDTKEPSEFRKAEEKLMERWLAMLRNTPPLPTEELHIEGVIENPDDLSDMFEKNELIITVSKVSIVTVD